MIALAGLVPRSSRAAITAVIGGAPATFRMRGLVGLLALIAVLAASCTSGSAHPLTPARVVTVRTGVTVQVPANRDSPSISASAAPAAATASLAGTSVRASASPLLFHASRPLPRGTTLSFALPDGVDGQGSFLASYDASSHRWTPVRTIWSPSQHTVSAVVSHFSIWAPLTWGTDAIRQALSEALSTLFGAVPTGSTPPTCDDTSSQFVLHDSVLNDSLESCVQAAGAASATLKITNTRAYPIDVITTDHSPVDVTGSSTDSQRLGAAFASYFAAAGTQSTLVPGRATAIDHLPLTPGATTSVRTAIDAEALLFSILDTAINELGLVYDHLATATFSHPDPALTTKLIDALITAIDDRHCLQDTTESNPPGIFSLDAARHLGQVAADCLSMVQAAAAEAAVAAVISLSIGLIDGLVETVWSAIDTASSSAAHTLTLNRLGVADTSIINFTPLDASGQLRPGLKTVFDPNTSVGVCATSRGALSAPGFFWCSTGDGEQTPCWEIPNVGIVVVCPNTPWNTTLYPGQPDPATEPPASFDDYRTQPWALTTADGRRCTAYLQGGVTLVDYTCADGTHLASTLDTRTSTWRAQEENQTGTGGLRGTYRPNGHWVALTAAWILQA